MARPVWTGAISFGVVNVPAHAMSAVRDHDVHFHQLDKKSGARVPLENALAMSTMRFADEIVPKTDIDGMPRASAAKSDTKTLRMATQLIDALASEWRPEQYQRHLCRGAEGADQGQGAGKRIVDEGPAEEPRAKVLDLMEALRNSVEAAKKPAAQKPAAQKPAAQRPA